MRWRQSSAPPGTVSAGQWSTPLNGAWRTGSSRVRAVGVDEVACRRGHNYLTLLYEIGEARRLLAVAEGRTEASFLSCLEELGKSVCEGVQLVCSDMWKPYLNVIAQEVSDSGPRARPISHHAEDE